MKREIVGQIHKVSKDYKIMSIQVVNKLEFFYVQPRFVKQFRKYLYPGVFVSFTAEDEKFKLRRRLVSKVIAFEKIIGNRYHRKFSYFDQKVLKKNILEKIGCYKYRLFLDLEMTLQHTKSDDEEIIQVGAILVDQNNQEILSYNEFVKPTKLKSISQRTCTFLNITEEDVLKNGISYQEFYQTFRYINHKYQPAIIVWGNNDQIALMKSYKINHVKPLFDTYRFINMQQVHKDYFNMNYELGLFNTAKIYQIPCGKQAHHAFEDAQITQLIFDKFYQHALYDVEFDFKHEMLKYHS